MKRIPVALLMIIVVAVPLVAVAQTLSTTTNRQPAFGKPPWERGEHFVYRLFFSQITRINQQAEEADRLGMNSHFFRSYYLNAAQLTPSQVVLLNQVAADLASQLAQYDAKAKEARTQWHVLVQTKRLNHEPIPPVPAEVRNLQTGREALILQARDRLQQGFGDAEFSRLDAWVRAHAPWKQPDNTPSAGVPLRAGSPPPDRAFYIALFHSLAHYKAQAQHENELGFPQLADSLRTIVQRRAGLTPEQAKILDRTTTEYVKQETAYKAQLEAAKLPYRKLTLDMLARQGAISPTPELAAAKQPITQVAAQMNALADSAIGRLHTELGDEAFAKIETYAKRGLARSTSTAVTAESQEVTK